MNVDENAIPSAIDKTIRAVLGFGRCFGTTLVRLIYKPSRIASTAEFNVRFQAPGLMPPFAFLASNCFLFAVTVGFLFTGASEFHADRFLNTLWQQASEPPNLGSMLLLTIPATICTLGVTYVMDCIILRERMHRAARVKFLSYGASGIMLGSFCLLIAKGILDVLFNREIAPRTLRPLSSTEHMLYTTGFLLSLAVIVIACTFLTANVARLVVRAAKPAWTRRNRAAAAALIVTVLIASVVPNFVIVSARDLLSGKLKPSWTPPRLTVLQNEIGPLQNGKSEVSILLYIENYENEAITIISKSQKYSGSTIRFEWAVAGSFRGNSHTVDAIPLRIIDSPNGKAPYLDIPPSDKGWLALEGTLTQESYASLLRASQASESRDSFRVHISILRGYRIGNPTEFFEGELTPGFK